MSPMELARYPIVTNKQHNALVDKLAKGTGLLMLYCEDGLIWIEGENYYARASDGVEVFIGDSQDSAALYLADYPVPELW